jgi:methanogenic corrinoid protein MtbC1/DNA-binding XRE family transcriptional regulator
LSNQDSRIESQVEDYLWYAVTGDEVSAYAVVQRVLADGKTVPDVYFQLFVPAQQELGHRWVSGSLSVANEHLASEVTSRLMNRLRDGARRKPALNKRVVVSAAPGERHALGARIVGDFLYLDGWDVDFLGADMPGSELADFVGRTQPALVAISVVLDENLISLRNTIAGLHASAPHSKILVGGSAIANKEEAIALGADAFGEDAIWATVAARHAVGLEAGETLAGLLSRVGENVQALRRLKNWKQQQLALAAGLDRAYLSGVENGKQNLSLSALHKLARALDVPTQDLLDW